MLLALAAILSFGVTLFGAFGIWFFGRRLSGVTGIILFILPVLVFPASLAALKSIKTASMLMWSLLVVNCVVIATRNLQHVYLALVSSRANEALIVIALLLHGAIYLQRKDSR
jgi:hypothetical protein